METIDFLIDYLLKEKGENPEDYSDVNKKVLYRTLVNLREPNEISEEFLQDEDEYLQEELKKKNVTDVENIKTLKEQNIKINAKNLEKISFWQGDITKIKIGAIVNAGNSQGLGCFIPNHNCIDNQINTFAGVRLRLACNEIMKKKDYNLKTGEAIITSGYNLPAEYVIQTVGPIIDNEVTEEKRQELRNCYINSLKLAIENNIKEIAFPCISTGIFRFPKEEAAKIAIEAVDDFITENEDKINKVVFCLWSDEDLELYKEIKR